MLDKAVAAVKADQAVALGMFNKGEGGFKDRDLYPFCFRISDAKALAGPVAVPSGTDVRTLKDPSGNGLFSVVGFLSAGQLLSTSNCGTRRPPFYFSFASNTPI